MTGPLAPVVLSSGAFASAAYYICSNFEKEGEKKEKDENEEKDKDKDKKEGGTDTSKEEKATKA